MREFAAFAWKHVRSSIFPLFLFAAMAVTRLTTFGLPRYDVLFALSIGMQVFMVITGLETLNELKMVCGFHLLGLCLELYKVRHGSWTYPEAGVKIGGVPLYSGFMYASIASYMMQGWRNFELKLVGWPNLAWLLLACIAIYLNFFLARAFGDSRWWIIAFLVPLFAGTYVEFTTLPGCRRRMPILLTYFLIGLFVWFAEHLCTWLHAWQYPYQREAWTLVDAGKLSSWVMMVIISFIIVAATKQAAENLKSRGQLSIAGEKSEPTSLSCPSYPSMEALPLPEPGSEG